MWSYPFHVRPKLNLPWWRVVDRGICENTTGLTKSLCHRDPRQDILDRFPLSIPPRALYTLIKLISIKFPMSTLNVNKPRMFLCKSASANTHAHRRIPMDLIAVFIRSTGFFSAINFYGKHLRFCCEWNTSESMNVNSAPR